MMTLPRAIQGWGARERGGKLERLEKPLPPLGSYDVLLKVTSCGVCHSDIHLIDNDWGMSNFPMVPGHEILGTAVAWGDKVSWLSEGARLGVGWQRSACLICDDCSSMRDNMCAQKTATCVDHWGGYADYHVTDARFAFAMPSDDPSLAPLLCGGATVFTPLSEFLTDSRARVPHVGVVGLGGLGHLAVKLARAIGAEVTLFSSSESKREEAIAMGVSRFVSSRTPEQISAAGRHLDLLIVTANVDLPWSAYLQTLRSDGTLCFVGIPPSPMTFHPFELLEYRLRVCGSPIGSRYHIRRMIELCDHRKIGAQIEIFSMDRANEAIERVRKNSVRYRAVLVP